jgi:hypothetical protein
MNQIEEFRRYMKPAGEQFNHPPGRHLSEEEIYDYCRGATASGELAFAREHISQCAACLEIYREASEFIELQQSGQAEVTPNEIENEWRTLRRRLPQLSNPAPAQTSWLTARWPFQISFKPALAFALLAVILGGFGYVLFRQSQPKPADIAQTSPTPAPSVTASNTPAPSPSIIAPGPEPPGAEVIAMDVRGGGSAPGDDLVRSEREEAVNALLAGQRLYVELNGSHPQRRQFAESLKQRLQSSGQFKLTEDREAAEIALKLTLRETPSAPSPRASVFARIVNADGKVIWPLTPRTSGRRYEGPTEKAMDRLSRDLLDDVGRLERKQK